MGWSKTQREYRREYLRKWRKQNPEKVRAYEKYRDRKNRKNYPEQLRNWRKGVRWLKNSIKNEPCKDCGCCFPPCAMDFDHRPGEKKLGMVSRLSNSSRVRMIAEIMKCDVVCSNCHRIRTHRRSHGESK